MILNRFGSTASSETLAAASALGSRPSWPAERRSELRAFRLGHFAKFLAIAAAMAVVGWLFWKYPGSDRGFLGLLFWLTGIALMVLGALGVIASPITAFGSLDQSSPEKASKDFYLNVLTGGNFAAAYKVLAPVPKTTHQTLQEFQSEWQKVKKDLESALVGQLSQHASCSICQRSGTGVRVKGLRLNDDWVRVERSKERYLVDCSQCGTTYCPACFNDLGMWRTCKKCGLGLKTNPVDALVTQPTFELKFAVAATSAQPRDETVADVVCEMEANAVVLGPSGVRAGLGEDGKVKLIFENTAARLGQKWYLLSPPLESAGAEAASA